MPICEISAMCQQYARDCDNGDKIIMNAYMVTPVCQDCSKFFMYSNKLKLHNSPTSYMLLILTLSRLKKIILEKLSNLLHDGSKMCCSNIPK